MIRSPFKVLLVALAATWIFFFEYLPPVRTVHLPYDIEGYHYPLADYAFQSLKEGRWPQWDPSIYSGMAFAANPQVALYYPGTWIMFLAKWGQERLSYQALLDLTLAHVALAFTLCFFWLRGKRLVPMAALFGAAVYAYSGYTMTQLQHFGLMVVYTWMPLGFMGIDEAAERNSWKPLWKLALASSLAFLGGYPPVWIVFAVAAGAYALFSKGTVKTAALASVALLFGLIVCGIQLLPAWEATHFREPELRYGIGIKNPMYFVSYLIGNFWDFGLETPVMTNFGFEYLYLGAPGLLGIVLAFRPRLWRALLPAIAMGGLSLIFATNPYAIVWDSIKWSPLLSDVIRSAYHMGGVAPALALLAAIGLDAFLQRERKAAVPTDVPTWARPVALGAMAVWAAYEIARFPKHHYAIGWAGAWDTLGSLVVFALGLWVFRASTGKARVWMGVALVLSVAIDYKVFGTSKRFDGSPGQGIIYSNNNFGAMNHDAYMALRPPSDYRIMMMDFGPPPQAGRHVGWTTMYGFDPFVSIPFRELIKRRGSWVDDRTILLDPLDPEVMRVFGAKFVTTAEVGPKFKELMASPKFKMVGENDSYYKVFEYLDAQPIYQFPAGTLKVEKRVPEHRVLKVDSAQGGVLTFSENWFPGWSAKIDGQTVAMDRWEDAFQSLKVPAGAHTVELIYSERLLPAGAAVSVLGLVLLGLWIRAARSANLKEA